MDEAPTCITCRFCDWPHFATGSQSVIEITAACFHPTVMATTTFGVNDALAVKLWSKNLAAAERETLDLSSKAHPSPVTGVGDGKSAFLTRELGPCGPDALFYEPKASKP